MELIMPEHHPQTHHARVRFFFFLASANIFFLTGGCNTRVYLRGKSLREKKKNKKKKQACMYVYLKKNKSWDWEDKKLGVRLLGLEALAGSHRLYALQTQDRCGKRLYARVLMHPERTSRNKYYNIYVSYTVPKKKKSTEIPQNNKFLYSNRSSIIPRKTIRY